MRRLAILTVAAGLALTIGLAAQTGEAQAMMQQCTGDEALTLNPDGTQTCGSTEISVTGVTLDGVEVTIQASDPSFAEPMEEGDWVEVELIIESEMAANAIDSGSDQLLAASATDAKNTAEVAAVVGVRTGKYVPVMSYANAVLIQTRPPARSEPARRGQSRGEVIGRTILQWIEAGRRAILPQGHVRVRVREYGPNGQLQREIEVDGDVG